MKKILLILTLSLFILSAGGCNTLPQGGNEVENSPEVSQTPEVETTEIKITSEPVNVEGFEALSKCMYDVINDENEDTITLYTSAGRDMKGEMMWDDTQQWVLQVETDEGVYDLYNERIHGRAYVNVSDYHTDGADSKVISLYIAGRSFNEIREYSVSEDKFIEEITYTTDDRANEGIGSLYSSIPDYE